MAGGAAVCDEHRKAEQDEHQGHDHRGPPGRKGEPPLFKYDGAVLEEKLGDLVETERHSVSIT